LRLTRPPVAESRGSLEPRYLGNLGGNSRSENRRVVRQLVSTACYDRIVTRAVIHVDMDAFYASVEQRDDAKLRGRPVIVGGHARRGVVLAASYEVRPFGVRSAMPMARAVKLAPDAIVVPPHFDKYANASEGVFAIFERFTPLIEPLSLDEAFLDVTGSIVLFGPAAEIASKIRAAIAEELDLPASAGIAEVKFVAKIASDLAKPNGQKEVPPGQAKRFLAPLPVARLWGVGPKMEAALHRAGLYTIADVAQKEANWLEARLGEMGLHLFELSRGIDDRVVVPDREAKSIGSEDTFENDLAEIEELSPHVHSQALRVARRMRKAGLVARVVVLKYKLSDFTLKTRRTTLAEPTDDGQRIFEEAMSLLARAHPFEKRVRLTGVSAHDLVAVKDAQLGLFETKSDRSRRLNRTLDVIAERFGAAAVLPADLVGSEPEDREEETRRLVGASRLDAARAGERADRK
jgi:DNA polymerase IV